MAFTFHYVTGTGAGVKSGASWATAFDWAAFQAHIDAGGEGVGISAGDVYVFEGNTTYNMTDSVISAVAGTNVDPVVIIGVKENTVNEGDAISEDDFPDGDARPLFSDGSSGYGISGNNYWVVMNIRVSCNRVAGCFVLREYSRVVNCKATQNYTGASSPFGIHLPTSYACAIDCEVTGAECTYGIYLEGWAGTAIFCYIHDITEAGSRGIAVAGIAVQILFNIFDNLPAGISQFNDPASVIFGNTFYDCDRGIEMWQDAGIKVINNVFASCATDAIYWGGTAGIKNYFRSNHFHDNADDYDGVIAEGDANDLLCDFWDTAGDPDFTVAGSDFSLDADSPCIDAGMAMRLGVGA